MRRAPEVGKGRECAMPVDVRFGLLADKSRDFRDFSLSRPHGSTDVRYDARVSKAHVQGSEHVHGTIRA